jgi:hypothetical protein
VRAKGAVQLLQIRRGDLAFLLGRYPELYSSIRAQALQTLRRGTLAGVTVPPALLDGSSPAADAITALASVVPGAPPLTRQAGDSPACQPAVVPTPPTFSGKKLGA